jgi:hypothetical protein
MKNILALFKNLESFSFLLGMMFGAALGLVLFSYLVPNGPKMIGVYRSSRLSKLAEYNQNAIQDVAGTSTTTELTVGANKTITTCSGYATPKVTSEKQFLQLMKTHHEVDILMATQMTLLTTYAHPETKTLAKNIINQQNTELKMIRDWLAAWK